MHPERFRGIKVPTGDSGVVESPCIRNCCLDGDDVCVGCFRSLEEIVGWSAAGSEERTAILRRCDERRAECQRKRARPPVSRP